MLDPRERSTLLALARQSIAHYLSHQAYLRPAVDAPALCEPRGAFVTLKKHGMLRGCIGALHARLPLWETVVEMAVAAAFEDPRFISLTANELPQIDIEISVLSPMTVVKDSSTIEVGVHGLYVQKGGRSGLLLPQVATEYGWDRETFLRHTCQKAGLPEDAWRSGATVSCFTAEIIH